jgi:signal peptidase I
MEAGAVASPDRLGVGRPHWAACLARRRGLLVAVCCVVALWALPFRPGVVVGGSMWPSFRSGQVFLMSRAGGLGRLVRGDVVVFDLHGRTFIKRIVGLPGDEIWGIGWNDPDGTAAQLLSTEELPRMRALLSRHPALGRLEAVQVPAAHIFVVGDAANNSLDSRQLGPIPVEAICGRVVSSVRPHDSAFPSVPMVAAGLPLSRVRRPPGRG